MHRKRKPWLPLGLGLAVLVVAAAVVIPTVATAGSDAAAPATAGHDMAGHAMAGHAMAAKDTEGLQPDLAQVRRVTARYHDLDKALEAGYELGWVNGAGTRIITGCVAHPTDGAMGYHYFHPGLMADLAVDPLEPEALVYERKASGKLKLVAVEYVVRGANSNPPGVGPPPPTVFGMDMVILVPAVGFWTLHAWVWGHNPSGMFAHWNPEVSCP
jgi:hypothetical protein